jgi:hypothetical protein
MAGRFARAGARHVPVDSRGALHGAGRRASDAVRDPLAHALALGALREEEDTVTGLASRLGYRSEAAFSRAIKRVVGVLPGAVRRATLSPTPTAPR